MTSPKPEPFKVLKKSEKVKVSKMSKFKSTTNRKSTPPPSIKKLMPHTLKPLPKKTIFLDSELSITMMTKFQQEEEIKVAAVEQVMLVEDHKSKS